MSSPSTLPATTSRSKATLLAFVLSLLVVVATGFTAFNLTNASVDIDDAPITYRYAENIAAGHGFVYNLGERVQGTSTPLYTLLLALLAWIGAGVSEASNALNLTCTVVGLLLVFLTTWRVCGQSWLAGLLAVGFTTGQVAFLRYASAGMETAFYSCTILAALLALTWKDSREAAAIAALAAALATVTRLDGLAVAVAVFGTLLIRRGRVPWREFGLFAVVAGVWFAFAWIYFGSPLPQSMLAKQTHLQMGGDSRYWIWESLFGLHAPSPTFLMAFAPLGIARLANSPSSRSWLAAPLLWLSSQAVCGS